MVKVDTQWYQGRLSFRTFANLRGGMPIFAISKPLARAASRRVLAEGLSASGAHARVALCLGRYK